MKKILALYIILLITSLAVSAQDPQEMVSRCALGIGDNTTYLKDFVIKLPKAANTDIIPIHKANIYLMKNQNYRFTMCNSESSEGQLVLSLYDKQKLITSSFVKKSGNLYNSVEFNCNKTGLYQLWYNFKDGEKGMGVGIVSLVK